MGITENDIHYCQAALYINHISDCPNVALNRFMCKSYYKHIKNSHQQQDIYDTCNILPFKTLLSFTIGNIAWIVIYISAFIPQQKSFLPRIINLRDILSFVLAAFSRVLCRQCYCQRLSPKHEYLQILQNIFIIGSLLTGMTRSIFIKYLLMYKLNILNVKIRPLCVLNHALLINSMAIFWNF